jgi:hypothetical protein
MGEGANGKKMGEGANEGKGLLEKLRAGTCVIVKQRILIPKFSILGQHWHNN